MAMSNKVDLEKLRIDVQVKFDQIREALNVREKLLLRQIDVILTSQQHQNVSATNTTTRALSPSAAEEIQFITENEENVLNSIRSYGKFNLDSVNIALQDLYTNEDYIAPAIDHETMYKCLSNSSNGSNANDEESIVVDFSANRRLFRDNLNNMNESIINITLNEAKELIQKSNKVSAAIATEAPVLPLNLDGILDEDDEDIDGMPVPTHSKSSQTVTNKRKPRFKPKITINNCNGTINLKNISNLTINCAKEDSLKATDSNGENNNVEPPKCTTADTTTSNSSAESNHSNSSVNSASSSSAISPKQHDGNHSNKRHMYVEYHEDEDRSATCEFYNRLLNEIKNNLKQKTPKVVDDNRSYMMEDDEEDDRPPVTDVSTTDDGNGNEMSVTSQTTAPNKKLVLRNFENLKIILEANDNSDAMRPVQIEQWLAEIISETEIEPVQNTDILEHSKINSGGTC